MSNVIDLKQWAANKGIPFGRDRASCRSEKVNASVAHLDFTGQEFWSDPCWAVANDNGKIPDEVA